MNPVSPLVVYQKEEERRIRDILQVNLQDDTIGEIDESILHLSNSDLALHSFCHRNLELS